MATLKGQNLRIILTQVGSHATKQVVAMSTNCTINLTNNTESGTTKDDTGMADKPITVSKGWSVQVESFSMVDLRGLLFAAAGNYKYELIWDEVSETDNQTPLGESFARTGLAFITDLTLNFDDRTNSAKNITFTGTGAITTLDSAADIAVISSGSFTKGQFVRLFLSNNNTDAAAAVIAAAKQLQFHVSVGVENATTKDTEGEWIVNEPVSLTYDITSNALVRSGDTITSAVTGRDMNDIEEIYELGTPVKFDIANVSGANQRTKGASIVSGSVVLTQLQIQGPNRQTATYNATMVGYGAYSIV